MSCLFFVFFKQKTAYEVRISDWSSDVCSSDLIALMGDKVVAKKTAQSLGIPVVPGSDGAITSAEAARSTADAIGYPVLIKASAGGGGRGMKVAKNAGEVEDAYRLARSEAKAAFGNDEVYMEKYLGRPRHIEVQLLRQEEHRGGKRCGDTRKA